jgi:hypothetical protein
MSLFGEKKKNNDHVKFIYYLLSWRDMDIRSNFNHDLFIKAPDAYFWDISFLNKPKYILHITWISCERHHTACYNSSDS